MSTILKLDFNERSDSITPLLKKNNLDTSLWRYPERQPLEKQLATINNLLPSQVLCTNGGDEAIMILMRIIKENSRLILPLPAFSQYLAGIESWQQSANLIKENLDLTINVIQTLKAIEITPNAVTIITRPNNPTGESIPIESLIKIIQAAKKSNGWIFLDEAYIEFSQEADENNYLSPSLIEQFDNLIILRTLSKAYGLAGIRVGYLLGSEKLVTQFKNRCIPFNVPQPSLMIASQALNNHNKAEVKKYCQLIRNNRLQITDWLASINIRVIPSQANFILLQLPKKQAKAVQSFLAKNSILVRSFSNRILAKCLRISIPANSDRLLKALEHVLVPKLICLDMDGVLIDTSDSYDKTIQETVKQLSGKMIELSDIYQLKDRGGYNNDWVLSHQLLKTLGIKITLDEVIKVFQYHYLGDNNDGLVKNEKPIISTALITKINTITKTQFAIVTGRPYTEAHAGLQFLALNMLPVVSLDDVKNPKPAPDGINQLQEHFSALSWMCGDNPDDIQAAVASHSLAIGIGKRNSKKLYDAGADIVLDDINELEKWLCPIS